MNLLAVTTAPSTANTLDKLRAIPADFWLKLGLAVVGLVVLVAVLRKVAQINKVVLAAVAFITVTVVGFNWIYERSEPSWATPTVNVLAGFFPSKGVPAKTAAVPPAKRKP